jgi:prepilin-type N-terminal cleavage/methylation domain-containing protein
MTRLPTLQHGFSYVEVLVSVALLAVLLVPALQALQSGISDAATPSMAARPQLLRAKMEEVLSRPFPDLYAATYVAGANTTGINATYSDDAAAADRRLVVLYRYDGSAKTLSAGDTGLLYVSVYYSADGSANAFTTLAGRWW